MESFDSEHKRIISVLNLQETQLLLLGKSNSRPNYVMRRSCLESSNSERAVAVWEDNSSTADCSMKWSWALCSQVSTGEGGSRWNLPGPAVTLTVHSWTRQRWIGSDPRKRRMGCLVKGRRPPFGLEEPNIWSGWEKRKWIKVWRWLLLCFVPSHLSKRQPVEEKNYNRDLLPLLFLLWTRKPFPRHFCLWVREVT